MVTDAAWLDMNGDKKNDLVVVGEWMPITVYVNNNGKLENRTSAYFDKEYSGWWNKLLTGDFNHDGKQDLIAGNVGLNTQCKASDKQPADYRLITCCSSNICNFFSVSKYAVIDISKEVRTI